MNASAAFKGAYDGAEEKREDWPEPDLTILGAGRSEPSLMPTAVFGDVWPLIIDLAEGAGSPVDYVALNLLVVSASLIGGKRKVRPFDTSIWSESAILWGVGVGDPATNKTPGFRASIGPLRQMEDALAAAFEDKVRQYDGEAERARAECKQWEKQVTEAVKEGHPTPEKPVEAMVPDEPARRRLILGDATPESVGAVLSGNPFGTYLFRDEVSGWLMSFDRYSPGGREFWLEAINGDPFVIDRKSNPKPIRIPYNGVCVCGGIQPEKLTELLLRSYDDGLIARFIWSWPNPIPYARPRKLADISRLEKIYRRLEGLLPDRDPFSSVGVGRVLSLEPRAADAFEAWKREHDSTIGDAASLFKGFCGKLSGMVLRVALVSELLRWADTDEHREPEVVTVRSLGAAIEFFEDYGKPHALRVFGDAALPPIERNVASLAKYIQREGLTVFNQRDLRQKCGVAALKSDHIAMDAAIEALLDADWIKAAPARSGASAGRARKDFRVNPRVLARAA